MNLSTSCVLRFLLSELEASRTAAGTQAKKQIQLEKQLETALLAKKRLQELDSGKSKAACVFATVECASFELLTTTSSSPTIRYIRQVMADCLVFESPSLQLLTILNPAALKP